MLDQLHYTCNCSSYYLWPLAVYSLTNMFCHLLVIALRDLSRIKQARNHNRRSIARSLIGRLRKSPTMCSATVSRGMTLELNTRPHTKLRLQVVDGVDLIYNYASVCLPVLISSSQFRLKTTAELLNGMS